MCIRDRSKVLNSGKYFSSNKTGEPQNYFDGQVMNYYYDLSVPCYAGMEFREGYVAVLSKARFFIGDYFPMHKYIGYTTFQGSMDGVTYTTIYSVDNNIHQGWNYIEWDKPEDQPKYRFYRIRGGRKQACQITELELFGVESI